MQPINPKPSAARNGSQTPLRLPTFSLRGQLVLVVMAAMLPLLALTLIKAVIDSRAAITRASSELDEAAARVVASQDRIALSARNMLLGIANVPGLLTLAPADCQRYFGQLNEQLSAYLNLGLVDIEGHARCHGMGESQSLFLGDRDYFLAALQRRSFVVGAYSIGRATGRPQVSFALPVFKPAGPPAAVLYASLDVIEFSKMMTEVPLPVGGKLVVTDRDGVVLAAVGTPSAVIGQPMPRNAGALPPEPAFGGFDGRIFSVRSSGQNEAPDFYVIVSADRAGVLAPERLALAQQLAALLLVGLFGGALARRISGRAIVKPVQELLAAHRQIEEGWLQVRVATPRLGAGAEFARMGEGFNRMAESLELRDQTLMQRDLALQAELARSLRVQRRLENAQRIGRIGNWESDLAADTLWWSDEVYALFGLRPDTFECTPAHFLQLLHPDDQALFEKRRDAALRAGAELDTEYRIVTPQGDIRWIHQVGQLQAGAGNGLTLRVGVVQDITDRKQAELALASSADLQRRTGEMAQIGGWQLELDTLELASSAQVLRIYENDAHQPLGFAASLAAFGGAAAKARLTFEAALDAARLQGLPWDLELPMTTRRGKAIWVRTQGRAITEAGRIVRLVGALQDITERKLADRAALESEQRYSALFASAPVPMWVFDAQTLRFLAVNEAAVQAYGYSRAQFRCMTLFDIRPASEHDALRRDLDKSSGVAREVWTHRRRDGSAFPVNVVSRPISHGGRDARFVVALDMTAQRQAEAAMQAHLATLQRAADAAQAITWHHTLAGLLQEVADQARGVVGSHGARVWLAAPEAPGGGLQAASASPDWVEGGPALESPAWLALYRPVFESNRTLRLSAAGLAAQTRLQPQPQPPVQPPVQSPNGEPAAALSGVLAVPLRGRDGNNIGLLQLSAKYEGDFTQQDEYAALELARLVAVAIENARLLDERQQMALGLERTVQQRTAELTRQEALFRALAQQAPEVVWTADPQGRVTYLNRAWFDLMGGDFKRWRGHRWVAVLHSDDLAEVRATWAAARAAGTRFAGVRRLIAQDGRLRTMSYRASPVHDEAGQVAFWVGIDTDITDIKGIEAALRRSNEELEAFSYSVSHDLRSPLNTIDGFSRLLARQIEGEAGEKARHFLARIHAGVAQMGQLIEDLLSLAQVSRAELRHEPVDLSALALRSLDSLRDRDTERQVQATVEPGLMAEGDARLIQVVLDNLLANAWKFSLHRKPAEITVGQTRNSAGQTVFFVRDNGAGFDMAHADKLFRAFQRLHTAAEFAGTGIGLATVQRIVGRHGGQLWADAVPDGGATFFFTLPKGASTSPSMATS